MDTLKELKKLMRGPDRQFRMTKKAEYLWALGQAIETAGILRRQLRNLKAVDAKKVRELIEG